jgi:hypothetical protein
MLKYQHMETVERRRLQNVLSRRERQAMSVVYAKKGVSAQELLAELPDPPGHSSVRSILSILEAKGLLRHLLKSYFDDPVGKVVAAILETNRESLSGNELNNLSDLIEESLEGWKQWTNI